VRVTKAELVVTSALAYLVVRVFERWMAREIKQPNEYPNYGEAEHR
jgi:hypothetical protein